MKKTRTATRRGRVGRRDAPVQKKSFRRVAFVIRDDLLGARWWHEGMQMSTALDPASRRSILKGVLALGGIAGGAGLIYWLARDDDQQSWVEALAIQRQQGWDVGSTAVRLAYSNASLADADGNPAWQANLTRLGDALAPAQAALTPFYVRTLFQVLTVASPSLRRGLWPVHSTGMDGTFGRAQALAFLLAEAERPTETAVMLDLPGPDAVAAAAGMSQAFDPVLLFDNWPHPRGVVPSHEVLGAAVYYLPILERARGTRSQPTPAVFVIDSHRLAPYSDASDRFDNRYVARMPPADRLRALGVRRLLYVTATHELHERDDLNDDFVAFERAGVDVRMLALADFEASTDPLAQSQDVTPRARTTAASAPTARYYWGGHPTTHVWFWHGYGWDSYAPSRRFSGGSRPASAPTTGTWKPVSRPTLFSSRAVGGLAGVGKQKPSGFGRVSVRTSRSTGAVTGVGRSGSWTRSRSSSSA